MPNSFPWNKEKKSPIVEENIRKENVENLFKKINDSLNTLEKILDHTPDELFQEEKNKIKERGVFISQIYESIQITSSSNHRNLLKIHLESAENTLPKQINDTNNLIKLIETSNPVTLLENIKNLAGETYLMIESCSSAMDWVNEQNTLIENSLKYLTKLISYKLPEDLIEQFEEKSKEFRLEHQDILLLLAAVSKHINTFLENPQQFCIQARNLEKELNFLTQEKIKPLNDSIEELKKKIIKECPAVQINATKKEEYILDYLPNIQCKIALKKLSEKCEELITQRPSSNKSEATIVGNDPLLLTGSECQETHSPIIYAELDFANINSTPVRKPTEEPVLYAKLSFSLSASENSSNHSAQPDSEPHPPKTTKEVIPFIQIFKK